VPYFKAGLENNEFCIWVTSEYLDEKEAEEAIRKAVPDFAQYLERGQIEIIPHTEWYLKDGVFNGQRVINAWIGKLERALANDYGGMRVTGDTDWVGKRYWREFTDYEKQVHNIIGENRMIALCTYSLDKCGASGVIDILGKNQFTLTTQTGDWSLTKNPKCKRAGKRRGMNSQVKSRGNMTPLQKRFVKSGLEDLDDREAIKLLMSICNCGRQKAVTKQCFKAFANIREVLSASQEELEQAGFAPQCIFYLKLLREIPREVLRERIRERAVYESSKEVFDYLYYSMRDLKEEVFKVIYLDSREGVIDIVDLFEGEAGSIYIQPREIVETAIRRKAASLLFVHNHPSGDPKSSKLDKRFTRDLVFVGNILQIRVLDHIIIGEDRYFSFADEGLIRQYEDDFLNVRVRRI